jgi:hypothetical protein
MLEDTELNERKVAAFFGRFPLFSVKIRSLQSQLDTLKVVNRANVLSLGRGKSQGSTVQLRLKSSSQSKSSRISQTSSDEIPTIEEESTSSEKKTRMLGASLWAILIKKEKKQHNAKKVQLFIVEPKETDKKQKRL